MPRTEKYIHVSNIGKDAEYQHFPTEMLQRENRSKLKFDLSGPAFHVLFFIPMLLKKKQ